MSGIRIIPTREFSSSHYHLSDDSYDIRYLKKFSFKMALTSLVNLSGYMIILLLLAIIFAIPTFATNYVLDDFEGNKVIQHVEQQVQPSHITKK